MHLLEGVQELLSLQVRLLFKICSCFLIAGLFSGCTHGSLSFAGAWRRRNLTHRVAVDSVVGVLIRVVRINIFFHPLEVFRVIRCLGRACRRLVDVVLQRFEVVLHDVFFLWEHLGH